MTQRSGPGWLIGWHEYITGSRERPGAFHRLVAHDPCRLVGQVKQFGGLEEECIPLFLRPLPPCAAGEAVWVARGPAEPPKLVLLPHEAAGVEERGTSCVL